MRPAVLYAAKSTKDEKGSIPTQLADCRALAEADGLDVVGEFTDEAMSAWSGDRGPGLANARSTAERLAAEHGSCVFVVQHSDRMARGDGVQAAHLVEYALWAIKGSVQIRSVQDPQTFSDLLYAVVTGQRNAEDSRRKSLAVQSGMERRARRGGSLGGPRRYGYEYPGHGAPMRVVPAEAEIVRRIYAEFLAGRQLLEISRGLTADGIRPARAKFWRHTTIAQIISNPLYIGKLRYKDQVFDGDQPPIVDAETFEQAQALLAARPKRGRGRPPKANHLFRKGTLRCECGESMLANSHSTANAGYYECSKRRSLGAAVCDMPILRRVDVDGAVYTYFEQVGLDLDATRRAVEEAQSRKLAEIRALRGDAERESQRAAEKLARVRRDYVDGALDAADWKAFRDEFTVEQRAADAEVERLRSSEMGAEADASLLDAEQEMLERLTEIRRAIAGEITAAEGVAAVRAALTRLFEGFTVRRSVPERVHVELVGETIWIEPTVRGRSIDGEVLRPVMRAVASDDRWPVFSGIPVVRK